MSVNPFAIQTVVYKVPNWDWELLMIMTWYQVTHARFDFVKGWALCTKFSKCFLCTGLTLSHTNNFTYTKTFLVLSGWTHTLLLLQEKAGLSVVFHPQQLNHLIQYLFAWLLEMSVRPKTPLKLLSLSVCLAKASFFQTAATAAVPKNVFWINLTLFKIDFLSAS